MNAMFTVRNDSVNSLVSSKPTGNALASLYPALVQCFTIILLGYVTGRGGWITTSHAKGLNTFTSKFALPALLFSSMATLDWSMVEWKFIGAIFISKASLYLIAFIFTLILKRPHNLGLAALAGIFVTQSNDFALGYPIETNSDAFSNIVAFWKNDKPVNSVFMKVCSCSMLGLLATVRPTAYFKAIYAESQPQFIQYLYLFAPISLVILNPIGFILLELDKASSQSARRSKAMLMLSVFKQIVTNPIILMTALGVAANFIFNHKLPDLLDNLLTTLGQSFSACALFVLGLSIVGKFNKTMKSLMMGSGMLIFAKLLLLPMISMGVTKALNCGGSTNSSAEYSMFAFLYGTFPTAPTVYLYSTQYGVGTDLIATSLVLGTVISAPLMFTSAMVVGMQFFTMNVKSILVDTSFDIAVLSLVCTVAVILLLIVTRRATRMPQLMVPIIALFQLLVALSPILEKANVSENKELTSVDYVIIASHSLGIMGVSTMTSVTAITIYCISRHSTCRALLWRPRLLGYGIGVPVILTAAILMLSHIQTTRFQGFHPFNDIQLGVICSVLIMNIILTIFTLVLRHRRLHNAMIEVRTVNPSPLSGSCSDGSCGRGGENEDSCIITPENSIKGYGACSNTFSDKSNCSSTKDETKSLINIEDIVPFPCSSSTSMRDERMCLQAEKCSKEQVRSCSNLLENYDRINEGNVNNIYDYQLGRMLVLLALLLVSQITVTFYYMWQVVLPDISHTGLFVELAFIYLVVCTGQGFFTFLTFGLDSEVVIVPIKKLFLRITNKVREGGTISLSDETSHTCQQFSEHHLEHCKQSLERLHSSKQDCFIGATLVTWLIDAGLAADSAESAIYAEHLLQGCVIKACSKRSLAFFDTKRHIYQFGKPFLR